MTDPMRESPAPDVLGRAIFSSAGEVFTLQQVLGAAECCGLADGLWAWLEDALASASYAEEEGFQSDEEQLQTALDDFRYERRLLSAEETERWLTERQLCEEELVDTLERESWRRRFQEELSSIRRGYAPTPEQLAAALWPALFVPDRLGPMAMALARRVVASCLPGARPRPCCLASAPPPPAQAAAGPRGCPPWARCSPAWRRRLQELEGAYQSALASLLSKASLEAALVPRRLELTRFRLLCARFTGRDAAREALLCLTEDGESFQEASSRAGARREDRELFLEQAPEALAPLLVSALPGESFLVEESEEEEEEDAEEGEEGQQQGGPLLVQVEHRSPPALEDPAVRERLESSLLERGFAPVLEQHVRWLIPLGQS